MSETLLQKFIREKLEGYVEPKKRVPKGERKGLSKKKLHAALLMLTNDPLKDIAKRVGVSHGFLLVWRTREEFREKVAELHCEFTGLLSERVSHIADFDVVMSWLGDFKDVSRFSDSLLLNIFENISALRDADHSWIRAFAETNVKRKPCGATVKFIKKIQPIFLIFLDVFLSDRSFDPSTEYVIMLFKSLYLADLPRKIYKIYRSAGLSDQDFYLFSSFWTKLMTQQITQSVFQLSNALEAKLSQISTTLDRIPDKGAPLVPKTKSSLKKISSEITWTGDLNRRVQRIFDGKNPWQWLLKG